MSRGRTPYVITEQMAINALQMIGQHVGRPCPTRREIMQWTGVPRRDVWAFLEGLAEREPPLIEIERRCDGHGSQRRLRVMGGAWTGWTARSREMLAA